MKTVKIIALTLIALSFVSCDIFLAPVKPRYNPLDPGTTLKADNSSRGPNVDGWIESAMTNFADVTFQVTSSQIGLIRFDLSKLPPVIKRAELRLYNQNMSTASDVKVCKIVQPWDPGTISWATVTSGAFFELSGASATIVPGSGVGVWDVTPLIKSGAPNGFCIVNTGVNCSFRSMENATDKPQLVIQGFNYPD
jgi:hypothetical protein